MDIATFLGIISAFGLVTIAIILQGDFSIFLNVNALLIVLGGTLGATLIHYPLKDVVRVFNVARNVFFYRETEADFAGLIPLLVRYAKLARREGLIALERILPEIDDQFFYEGMRMVVDGFSPDTMRQILRNEIDFHAARHRVGISIFRTMGQYAPSFGMIGTLIGLIFMLRSLQDPAAVASGMAVALVTTFYGAMLANIVFLPIAGKLQERSKSELLKKEMVLAGILSIQSGETPGMVEQRMISFLPTGFRRIYGEEVLK